MKPDTKSVENVGGEDNADLIFQLAIDDENFEKDWEKIAKIVGNSVSPDSSKKWFEAITQINKKDRWTKTEEDILRSLIVPTQKLTNNEICEMFKNRSKKAVLIKISKIKKSTNQSNASAKLENYDVSSRKNLNYSNK